MNAEQHVPQFRFKDFSDSWEQRKVSELADRYDNLRVPITASERVAGETPYYGANGIQDYVEGFTHNGEFVLVAEDGANDLQNYPVQYVDGKIWVNNHAHVLQAKEERVDNKFLTNALKHTNIEPYLVGGGRAKLNADVMMKINFKVPTLPEQVQIGKFFDNLDHLITLHQRKLAKLKELKKGYLQKLFPQNSEKVPEFRFKGYSDAWEKRKLGELAEFINGRAYKQDELLSSGKYPVLRVGNFYTNDKWYYSNLELPEKYYAEEGDLLYTWSATFGPHIWIGPKVIYHYHIWKVALKNIFEKDFALQFFEADRVRLLNSTNGSTMIHVTKKDMESKGVLLPDISEQRNIGELLRKADDLIAATHCKLDLLKKLKKGYLQKMFC
jgi:type I restriction enzyme S subunit